MYNISVTTGAGGFDLFNECLEESMGLERIYCVKPVGFLKRKTNIKFKKSARGKYYRLVRSYSSMDRASAF